MPDETIPLETLHIVLSQRVTDALTVRVERLMIELTQMMREEYEQQFTVNDAGGAASSLTFEVTRTGNFIEAVIGSGKANTYLQYLEYGVRGTRGGSGQFQRTHMPPVKTIYDWIKRAHLAIPDKIVAMAQANDEKKAKGEHLDSKRPWYTETDPIMMYAYWVGLRIKQFGNPALRIIERVLTAQQSRIQAVLSAGINDTWT